MDRVRVSPVGRLSADWDLGSASPALDHRLVGFIAATGATPTPESDVDAGFNAVVDAAFGSWLFRASRGGVDRVRVPTATERLLRLCFRSGLFRASLPDLATYN